MWIELLLTYCIIIVGCCITSWFAMSVGFSSYKQENVCSSFAKTVIIALLLIFPIVESVILGIYFNDYDECPDTFQWLILGKLSLEVIVVFAGYCVYKKRTWNRNKGWMKIILGLILFGWCGAASFFLYYYDINEEECNKGRTQTYYDFMWVELMLGYMIMCFWFCAEIWMKVAFMLAPHDEF